MEKSILLLLCIVLIIACKKDKSNTNKLGNVDMAVTGNTAAASHFEKGLLLLHSFEYEDARESFLQAQESDPQMAMAIWGEAMTYNHSLRREQDLDKATAALQKLGNLNYKKNCLSKFVYEFLK